ncbi:hypothetical protein E1178_15545 [Roseibium hamelinense]|nr:hypothetical protein [Roseibium hamelinense]MTI45022.1 hypothetical protein [Roseibium hamelinense]
MNQETATKTAWPSGVQNRGRKLYNMHRWMAVAVYSLLLLVVGSEAQGRQRALDSYFDCGHFISFVSRVNGPDWNWSETKNAIRTFKEIDRREIEYLYTSCYAILLDVIAKKGTQEQFHILKQQMALVSVTEGDLILIKHIPDKILKDPKIRHLLANYIQYVTDRLQVILLTGDVVRKNTIAYNCLQDIGISELCVKILRKEYGRFRSARVEKEIQELFRPAYDRPDPFISTSTQ